MLIDVIVSSSEIVCLVGGSKIKHTDILELLPVTDCFVGVDSGADHLLAADIAPAAVIGDMDSLSRHAMATFDHLLCHISEQDTTDFEKAVTRVEAPSILAVGFTGGRMDHMLAVLNVLARNPTRAIILIDDQDASFLAVQGTTRFKLPVSTRISLMPLSQVTVTATGLRWPLDAAVMHPTGMISSSNAAAKDEILIQTDGPLLITLPRAHLQTALKAAARAE